MQQLTGGQTDEPQQELLVQTELADRRQQFIEVEWLLQSVRKAN